MAAQYRLTGKIEGGELAELYRGERDGGSVVVKLFHERTSVKAYAQEIADVTNKLGGVHHPGIAHVIDLGLVKRRLAVVREDSGRYTLGQVLQRLNTKEVVITPALAMAMMIDLLDAVSEAHSVGVVHGAMTPGNVLVSSEGRPSVCDFGALAALNAVPALKKNFASRGRSAYRAPEMLKGEALTVQNDVYSLGAMTYELLTLREAAGEGAQVSTRREALPPPSRLDRRLNSRIDPIIMRALDPVPGRRYKSTSEFAAALREFLTANGGLPPREELKRFVDQLFPKDVQLEPNPTVPFADTFLLASVEGADIETIEDRSMVLTPRASFSGSLEDFPALREPREADTGPAEGGQQPPEYDAERERSTDWHAPAGAMPATARSGPKESMNADILKRVKRIEDFEGTQDAARAPTEDALPAVFPGRPKEKEKEKEKVEATEPKASTVAEPAESQPITVENAILGADGKRRRMITEERNIAKAEAARRRWIPLVAGSALAAVAFLVLGMWRWSSGQAVQPYTAPPTPRPRPVQPIKRPQPPPPERVEAPAPQKQPVVDECYRGPKRGGPVGYLSIGSTPRPVSVVIDKDTVCADTYAKIPVPPGTRDVQVIDMRTKEVYAQRVRIDAGRTSKLIPIFKSNR